MKPGRILIALALVALMLPACDKAPRGIIKESDMVDLMVDIYKADAYCESYPTQFPDDSTKMMLKQSVFSKHGVTQADYDTSLVWYAHNMDAYTDVHQKVIDRLNSERDGVDMNEQPVKVAKSDDKRRNADYRPVSGDSADLWNQPRLWMLTQGLRTGFIPFDIDINSECLLGDQYELAFKAFNSKKTLSVVLAADYSDGGTAWVTRNVIVAGWNHITLQTDSLRPVKRIYGYVKFKVPTCQVVYIDSVQMLRTRLNSKKYTAASRTTKVVERNVNHGRDERGPQPEQTATEPASHPPHVINGGKFRPKEGLHKPSTRRHIQQSPNAEHLPSRH